MMKLLMLELWCWAYGARYGFVLLFGATALLVLVRSTRKERP
jgi:hypothetical protein